MLASRPEILAKYGPPTGTIELRREIVKRILPMGIAVAASDVVVSSGCLDAIRIAIAAVTHPGDVVAVESPTFFGFLQLLREADLRLIEIPTHPTTGIDLDSLERSLKRHTIRAALVTPNFQNPTGATMPDSHKLRLGKLARQHNFTISPSSKTMCTGICTSTARGRGPSPRWFTTPTWSIARRSPKHWRPGSGWAGSSRVVTSRRRAV